jgi:arylformamidase
MLFDISRPLTPRSAVFPGDTTVTISSVAEMSAGASCNVTALTLSAHAGTHVDAPKHYAQDGIGIDRVSLDTLLGPCRVLSIDTPANITVNSLVQARLTGISRLIVHTRASDIPNDVWDPTFPAFEPDAAEWLGINGIVFIGTDAPSVDPADSKSLPAHNAFLRHNVIIAENLNLSGVPDGDYELIALPLSIVGIDAAPARIVLRTPARENR